MGDMVAAEPEQPIAVPDEAAAAKRRTAFEKLERLEIRLAEARSNYELAKKKAEPYQRKVQGAYTSMSDIEWDIKATRRELRSLVAPGEAAQ